MTVAPVIDTLKSVGVTAVELLPVQSFVSEQFLSTRDSAITGLQLGCVVFAGERIRRARCRRRVQDHGEALHAAGIEVILERGVQSHRRGQ